MKLFRKFLSIFLVFGLLIFPLKTQAYESDTEDYIQRMIQYYLQYQETAEAEIAVLLDYLEQRDPQLGAMWRKIMVGWAYHSSRMEINQRILPDGLPMDDSLCIVIMGYGLRSDGSMKEELVDRLVVGLSSAMKYPNAYVVVTGGGTSDVPGITEAGQMAAWLMERGVSSDRLIVEDRSFSTLQNVTRVYQILIRDYPQVTDVAVVTSDYHIRQSCTFFMTMFCQGTYESGYRQLRLISQAANTTGKTVKDLRTQAWGISSITGIPYDGTPDIQPELSE